MNDKKLNKGILEIKTITMTADEKTIMREQILYSSVNLSRGENELAQPVRSPWTSSPFFVWIENNRLISSTIVILLIIIMTGSSLTFASEKSLPGDVLYPIKINVTEPLRVALAKTPVAKAMVQAELINTRLTEAEALAGKGSLDKSKSQQISTLISEDAKSLGQTLDKVKETVSSASADEIRLNFKADVEAHAHVLDTIMKVSSTTKNFELGHNLESESKKVMKSVGGLEDSNNNDKTSSTTASGTDMPTATIRVSKPKEVFDETKIIQNKKDSIKALIDSTHEEIHSISTSTSNTNEKGGGGGTLEFKQVIINEAHKTLDNAQQSFDTATKHIETGDQQKANEDLKQAQSEVRQADTFLKAGVKVEIKNSED